MISQQTASDIAIAFREIESAERLLGDVKGALDKIESVDIRDVFGRRRHVLELGIPAGDNSRRLLQVPYGLAIPVIEANIAHHRACIVALNEKARAELAADEKADDTNILWCVHVVGPDDVHAAPDWETAARWAMMLNRILARSPDVENPPICIAQVEPWPHSPVLHAETLPKSIADMTPLAESPSADA